MLLERVFCEDPVVKSSDFLIKLRLWVFGVAWVHLCIAAVMILPIDMSKDENPKVRAYAWLKYRFITAWFNLINLGYFPLCLYCDWKERRGEESEARVGIARRVRDLIFTSILFPTVMWADTMFWRLYWQDKSLISPRDLFSYMPYGGQHSLHTVSLVMAIIDLLIIPRSKPLSVKPRLKLMTAFFVVYCIAISERYYRGEFVYELLESFSRTDTVIFVLMSYLEYSFYFSMQWLVIEYLSKHRAKKGERKEK